MLVFVELQNHPGPTLSVVASPLIILSPGFAVSLAKNNLHHFPKRRLNLSKIGIHVELYVELDEAPFNVDILAEANYIT